MLSRLDYTLLRKGLVLFWAVWLTLVAGTNLADALVQLDVLPAGFTWASYNFGLVEQTLAKHGIGSGFAGILFAGVIAWQVLALALLWRAWAALVRGASGTAPEVLQAFVVSLALFAAFLVATEVFVTYDTATSHKLTFIALIASLFVIRNGEPANSPD